MSIQLPRRNNPAELKVFDFVCHRLGGFDSLLDFEWVDGFLTALSAGPQMPPIEDWVEVMAGEAFGRAFADPSDRQQALHALKVRLSVLRDQLDPEALFEAPDHLRLEPLLAEEPQDDTHLTAGDSPLARKSDGTQAPQLGERWAAGFAAAVEGFPALWPQPAQGPADDEALDLYGLLLRQIAALLLAPDSAPLQAHWTEFYPDGPVDREVLVHDACFAVQELRVWFVDQAPKPPTRRVEAQPGRNDPCPCGSGKKFKKCHGAA